MILTLEEWLQNIIGLTLTFPADDGYKSWYLTLIADTFVQQVNFPSIGRLNHTERLAFPRVAEGEMTTIRFGGQRAPLASAPRR